MGTIFIISFVLVIGIVAAGILTFFEKRAEREN